MKKHENFEYEHFSGPHVVLKDTETNKIVSKLLIKGARENVWKPEPVKLSRRVSSVIDSSTASFRADFKNNIKK